MSSPLISNQSVTVQLPATDNVEKLKELLAEALKLQLEDYEVFHNGQQVFLQLDSNVLGHLCFDCTFIYLALIMSQFLSSIHLTILFYCCLSTPLCPVC